jgi:hypothetical protein
MRSTFLFRLLVVLAIAALSVTFAACGEEETDSDTEGTGQSHSGIAENEGHYLEVAGLKYQVQASRQLNQLEIDDEGYLEAVAGGPSLGNDEEWFAIFMRVENDGTEEFETAEEFEIHDTQDNVYTPVDLGEGNEWAFRPAVVPPGEVLPLGNAPAGERQPNGSLILFKIKRVSIDNRPLELIVEDPSGEGHNGTINLDV